MRHEIEVSVGDVIRIGDQLVTIIELQGQEVTFKITSASWPEDEEPGPMTNRPR